MSGFKNIKIKEYNAYATNLSFNKNALSNIIKEIYELENEPTKKYHSEGRTFVVNKGFHSCNLLDKLKVNLDEYKYLKILISRVQELLHNYFEVNDINFNASIPGCLKIHEIWVNILRQGDYNLPHNHGNYDISGNFYLQTLNKEDKMNEKDGALVFINYDSVHYYLPKEVKKEGLSTFIMPYENLGVLFQSHLKHIVLPHFSDKDRIGIAFNARYEEKHSYDDIYPTPYWLPITYDHTIVQEDIKTEKELSIKLKNNLSLRYTQDNIRKLIGKKITFSKESLKSLITTIYSIDYNKYFTSNTNLNIETNNLLKNNSESELTMVKTKTKTNKEQEPDDYFTNSGPWNSSDHYYYEDNQSDKLCIIFSGMGRDNSAPTFIFYNFLKNYKCDKLFVRDLSYTWFLNNPHFRNVKEKSNTQNTLDFLNSYKKPRHKNVYTIGCSAGGFAAIFYGHFLRVTKCLAFAPQTIISVDKGKFKDERWMSRSIEVEKNVNKTFLSLVNLGKLNMPTVMYFSHELDRNHCYALNQVNAVPIKVGDDNHLTALLMKRNGTLKIVIDSILNT